jgi:hypothetical protein
MRRPGNPKKILLIHRKYAFGPHEGIFESGFKILLQLIVLNVFLSPENASILIQAASRVAPPAMARFLCTNLSTGGIEAVLHPRLTHRFAAG